MAKGVRESAELLPDYMRQRVIEECRKQAEVTGKSAAVFFITAAVFIGCGAIAVKLSGGRKSAILLTAIFIAVSLLVGYLSFVKPRLRLMKAKAERYEYYSGRLTEKAYTSGEEKTYYRLVIDDNITCGCTKEQYMEAEPGEEYMVIYFGSIPEFCFRVEEKDRV